MESNWWHSSIRTRRSVSQLKLHWPQQIESFYRSLKIISIGTVSNISSGKRSIEPFVFTPLVVLVYSMVFPSRPVSITTIGTSVSTIEPTRTGWNYQRYIWFSAKRWRTWSRRDCLSIIIRRERRKPRSTGVRSTRSTRNIATLSTIGSPNGVLLVSRRRRSINPRWTTMFTIALQLKPSMNFSLNTWCILLMKRMSSHVSPSNLTHRC